MSVQLKNENFYCFNIGSFQCISISDGSFDYDPGHLFLNKSLEEVKEVLKNYHLPTDKITTPYTFLYVDTGSNKLLVDMGAGKLGPNTGKMVENLKLAGVQPEDIDTVIITHAHPDHIGGTINEAGNPNYPYAKYYIWEKEWDFWFSDDAFEKVDEHLSKIVPVEVFIKIARDQLGPIKDRISIISEEAEIVPGVSVHFAPGHTPGHMVVAFSSEGKQLFFTSDTVVFPFLLEHTDMIAVFDIDPELAKSSKRKIFNQVVDDEAWVLVQHFPPFPSLGHIIKKGNGWQWQPNE